MFKQNRIILISSRVIEFWCFWLLGSWGWGGGWMGVGGGWGGAPTHVHMHVHARICMHGKHGNFMQMAAPIGFGEILGIPYDVICTCVHAHACAHGWGAPSHHPPPPSTHPPPPRGDPQNHSKFNST